MNEVVKYNNQMNELSFRGFTEKDLDVFMAICSRMRDLGELKQVFDYDYLMDLTNFDRHQEVKVFHQSLQKMNKKLMQINLTIALRDGVEKDTVLFPEFIRDLNKRTLTVRVDKDCLALLNNLGKKFTRFELAEYVKLDGRYPKLLYQHLKQFRIRGWWHISLSDFREELAIPKSMPTMNIMSKIIKPGIEVIKSCKGFSDLEVEVIRSPRRGRAIVGYKFKWTPEKQYKGQQTLEDGAEEMRKYKESKKLKKKSSKKKTDFKNFEEHEYDMDVLENKLLEKRTKRPEVKNEQALIEPKEDNNL